MSLGNSIQIDDTALSEPVDKPREDLVVRSKPGETPHQAVARKLTAPEARAAWTISSWSPGQYDVNCLAQELEAQTAAVKNGAMGRPEETLVAQAQTLDMIFNFLAREARANMGKSVTNFDLCLRLALKAQSQCRTTLETLAEIKNPPVVYARQANVTTGPQQINNGVARTEEKTIEQNKLSGDVHELRPDTRAPALAGRTDKAVATLGEIHRAQDRIRKIAG